MKFISDWINCALSINCCLSMKSFNFIDKAQLVQSEINLIFPGFFYARMITRIMVCMILWNCGYFLLLDLVDSLGIPRILFL